MLCNPDLITAVVPAAASDYAVVWGHPVRLELHNLGYLPAHGVFGAAGQPHGVGQLVHQTSGVVVTVALVTGDC